MYQYTYFTSIALDAAGPAFEGTEPKCRLDESDALFVDAIHTDSSTAESNGIGIAQRVTKLIFMGYFTDLRLKQVKATLFSTLEFYIAIPI